MDVDHINHDKLDNTKVNLRVVTHQQNMFNKRSNSNVTSQFKGVSWDKRLRKWTARIYKDKKDYYLGLFANEAEAALTYNAKALELFGEFAQLNEIPEGARTQRPTA